MPSLALEAAAVLVSPAVLYFVLQLRGMAPPQLPDPSMHTTFIVAPHDIFSRYAAVFSPTARLREAARVGFLVPARLAYLLFGAAPGFFVFRYVLVLVAIVPAYVLGSRLYGRWAGVLAIVVIIGSPVLVTALGTDYPDSAVTSYLTGALASFALSCTPGARRPRWWLVAGGALSTMAVWSHGVAVPLVAVAIVVYVAGRLAREPAGLRRVVLLLVGVAISVTALLALCSALLLGQFDFILPTIRAEEFLSTPAQERLWHSPGWSWAPYDPYLLVPPAVTAALAAVYLRRRRRITTPQLFVVVTGGLQLAVFAYLQFFGSVQTLEMHFLSSPLWSSTNLMLALLLAELALPLAAQRARRYVPALLVLALLALYAAAQPRVPALTWAPAGVAIAAAIVVAAALAGRLAGRAGRSVQGPMAAATIVIVAGATLVLTVAPRKAHAALARTVYDPPPAYAAALGGSDRSYVDQYHVTTELPAFVGPPAYHGEQLLTWWAAADASAVVEPMGIYHSAFNAVSFTFPVLGSAGSTKIERRRAAQVLLLGRTGRQFAQAVRSLAQFQPTVARRAVLSHGAYHLHVWLIDLGWRGRGRERGPAYTR